MTCFRPLQAIHLPSLDNPVRVIPRMSAIALSGSPNLFPLPCGSCIGCKLDYSKQWAVRCVHESQVVSDFDGYNSFVTLTYNDEFNDRNGGALVYRDVQLFLKRLRIALDRKSDDYDFLFNSYLNLRFFLAGEYGGLNFRPHYHILFFNLDFDDKVLYSNKNGHRLYNSATLDSFWCDSESGRSLGFAVVGSLTLQSAGYVARYCTKKLLSDNEMIYFNKNTGEFLPSEFTQMSRRPGIAKNWWDLYGDQVYPDDKVVLCDGRFYKPPRFYDNQLEKTDLSLFEEVKKSRILTATSTAVAKNSTTDRLIVREKIQLKKCELLPRSFY